MSNVMFVKVTVTEIMAAKVRTNCQMPLNVATLNKHCSAICHSRNFVLHHITHQNVLYGHVKCDARRSNGFWENGCQSQNILQNAHFLNGSQSNIIDRRDLAEEHIWDSCMYKRPWNLRTSGSNRYENNARRSRGGYITPWKTQKRTYLRGKSSYSDDSSISGFEISCSTTLLLQCVIQNWYFYPKTAISWKRMNFRAFITATEDFGNSEKCHRGL